MHKRFFVAMTLALAISACEADEGGSSTTTTADATSGADSSGDSATGDSAGADTASADASGGDATTGDTAAADTASGDSSTAADTAAAAGFDKAGPVLAAKCATCHSGIAKAKFDGKDCATAAALSSKMKAELDKGAMPPKSAPALSADEKAAILDWIGAGASCK